MPTIAIEGPYHLVIFTHDHPPPHVHVHWAGGMVKVNLLTLRPLGKRRGKARKRVPKGALKAVRKHREALLEAWDDLHGGGD